MRANVVIPNIVVPFIAALLELSLCEPFRDGLNIRVGYMRLRGHWHAAPNAAAACLDFGYERYRSVHAVFLLHVRE